MTFKPGQSGNPSGRPKSRPFKDAIDRIIKSENPEALEAAARALFNEAKGGNIQAIKELADRMDGKVPQALIGGDENDAPIKMINRVEIVAASGDSKD
jgi:hypothetical protein